MGGGNEQTRRMRASLGLGQPEQRQPESQRQKQPYYTPVFRHAEVILLLCRRARYAPPHDALEPALPCMTLWPPSQLSCMLPPTFLPAATPLASLHASHFIPCSSPTTVLGVQRCQTLPALHARLQEGAGSAGSQQSRQVGQRWGRAGCSWHYWHGRWRQRGSCPARRGSADGGLSDRSRQVTVHTCCHLWQRSRQAGRCCGRPAAPAQPGHCTVAWPPSPAPQRHPPRPSPPTPDVASLCLFR